MVGRKLLTTAGDIQRRADVVFVGFVFMILLDLGLLVLFGVQHPKCKQRSPRVYISGVDHGLGKQSSGKEGNGGDRISLQVPLHALPLQGILTPGREVSQQHFAAWLDKHWLQSGSYEGPLCSASPMQL